MTKIIGLTGGIGSGKSTVAKYIAEKGIPVYIADDEAKKIMNDENVIEEIVSVFGNQVLNEDGKIDRKKLASIVFKTKSKLKKLNTIIHPKVKQHFSNWLLKYSDKKFIIKEVAILFETKGNLQCDKVILVTAPLNIRIERTMKRDGVAKEAILERINNQMPEEEKVKLADYVVENIDLQHTFKQVDELLKLINNS